MVSQFDGFAGYTDIIIPYHACLSFRIYEPLGGIGAVQELERVSYNGREYITYMQKC